jgi:hypothetical protein
MSETKDPHKEGKGLMVMLTVAVFCMVALFIICDKHNFKKTEKTYRLESLEMFCHKAGLLNDPEYCYYAKEWEIILKNIGSNEYEYRKVDVELIQSYSLHKSCRGEYKEIPIEILESSRRCKDGTAFRKPLN